MVELMRMLKTKSNENAPNYTSTFIISLLPPHSVPSGHAYPVPSIKCALTHNHSQSTKTKTELHRIALGTPSHSFTHLSF